MTRGREISCGFTLYSFSICFARRDDGTNSDCEIKMVNYFVFNVNENVAESFPILWKTLTIEAEIHERIQVHYVS